MTLKGAPILSIASLCLVFVGWYLALFVAPTEAMMGDSYRIIYVHVPAAAVALGLASLGLLVCSILGLIGQQARHLLAARAWTEIGLLFTVVVLATGSIWGKPTWGVWWTWDGRLTTTLILGLLFVAYLMLYEALPAGKRRIRVCSILGIIIFVDVPIVYYSVKWWRTLHQPSSLIEQKGSTYSPEMLSILLTCLALTLVFAAALWWLRFQNLKLEKELGEASFE